MYSLDNIYKSFDNNQVLKGVSLEIPKNKTTVLIGPSGSGKTTLLRCINLLEIPDSGTVNVNGSSMTFHEGQKVKYSSNEIRNIRMKTGMVFQNFQLFPHKTVLENIMEGPITVLKKDRSECEKEALSLLEKVGLSDKRDAYPGQLSGGQQQRIAIARALATQPKVLLCDEATSALDPKTTHSILELIRDINTRLGITVIVITHQMSVVEEICNKVAILDNGEVAEEGEVSTVFAHPKSEAARRLVMPDNTKDFLPGLTGDHVLRVVFNGALAAGSPLITQMAIDKGIAANILYASTRCIGDKVYGNMLLGLPSDEGVVKEATAYLSRKENVLVQEVTKDVQ